MLAWLLAVAPSPPPVPGPALPAPASLGPVGEWFLPALILFLSLLLDASASGDMAKRDRFAMGATYTAFLGFISIYGWADDIQRYFDDSWSLKVTGSAIAVTMHSVMVFVLLSSEMEWGKRQRAAISQKIGFSSKNSGAVKKINTKLHVIAALTACSYVLSRGPSSWIPEHIGGGLTWLSGQGGALLITWLGGGS